MTLTQLPPPADVVRRLGARARRDAGTRLAAGSALWLSLLLVTWWWVTGGGITDLGRWGTGLESVGRITGLVSAVLLLAQVVLMARVPVLERSFGQDELPGSPPRRLHVVQPDARPPRDDHLGLRRRVADRHPAHAVGPGRQLPRHAAGHRGDGLPGDGRGHERQGCPPQGPLRVVAPDAPLRLPRRRTRDAAPAVDRRRLHLLDRPPGLLVVRVDRRGRQRAGLAGRTAAVAQPAPRPPCRRRPPRG